MPDNDGVEAGASEVEAMQRTIAQLQHTIEVQRRVAFAAGLFRGDVTVSTLISSFAEGLLVIDRDQRIILVNQRLEEMFGYASDELVGQFLQTLLPQRFAWLHTQHVQAYFQEPHLRPMGQGLELAGRRKDGSEFPVETSLSCLDTQAGRFGLAFVTDITQRKQAERALQDQNAALNAFAHTVAHDLQASLGTVVGMSEYLLLARTEVSVQQLQSHLLTIANASRKMSRIVNELLLLASLRKDEVKLQPVEMQPVIEAALSRLSEVIERQQARVVAPEKYPVVMGYAPWLEEVWFNYLSNALKYGGQPPCIELGSSVQADGYVSFWVRDNGPGLTVEQQAGLFKANQQLDNIRRAGHGLGLSIVRQIMDKLDGQVQVDSAPGAGSVFGFSLLKA
ncbi:MAG: PAS domain-containing sensor histidine kinase [Chloroflexi bacterium]|nr:PAS domain-containing sensor histidine kinase [Chloroflexota bacterium]